MSESSFPFEGQTMTQAPAPNVTEPGGGNRKKLLALGGGIALLLLAVVAYFLVFAGAGQEDGTSAASPKPVVAAPETVEAPAADEPAKKERLSAKSFGRDPFKALITEPVESSIGSADVAGASGVTTLPGTSAPAPATPGTSSPVSSSSHSFRVVEVAPDNSAVTVKVDGEVYRNLKAGEVFATYFKVVLISGQVNSFQYGEEKFNVIGTKRLTIA